MSSPQHPGSAHAGKKRTLKDCLPKAGFQYTHPFADRATADAVLAAMQSHADRATAVNLNPSVADSLLVDIFHRASERVNLVPRLSHPKFWYAVSRAVPWFRGPGLEGGSHVIPHTFQLLATYLVQARLRALDSPAIGRMSQSSVSRTAEAIDGYVALLRTRNLGRYVPDHTREDWVWSIGLFRPQAGLAPVEQAQSADGAGMAGATAATRLASGPVFTKTAAADVAKFKGAFESGVTGRKRKAEVSLCLSFFLCSFGMTLLFC